MKGGYRPDLGEAPDNEPEDSFGHHCEKCGDSYTLRDGCEPTTFCDTCAQSIVARLEEITPEPPREITYECGVEILNALQKELFDRPHRRALE